MNVIQINIFKLCNILSKKALTEIMCNSSLVLYDDGLRPAEIQTLIDNFSKMFLCSTLILLWITMLCHVLIAACNRSGLDRFVTCCKENEFMYQHQP